jgi:hypothetical protein
MEYMDFLYSHPYGSSRTFFSAVGDQIISERIWILGAYLLVFLAGYLKSSIISYVEPLP